jgi:hypothetical protein
MAIENIIELLQCFYGSEDGEHEVLLVELVHVHADIGELVEGA